jgi:heme exporter protein B
MKKFLRFFFCEMQLHARQPNEWAALVLFFLIVILLLPFAIGPEPDLLQRLAPGLVWLGALLMSLLALEKLFVADARDGMLDLLLLSPLPLPVLVFGKLLAQTSVMLGALILMLAPAAIMLNMKSSVLPVLLTSLCLGVPVLVFLGGIASAVTVTLHRNAALLTLLLVPFYIPVFIFGVSACDAALMDTAVAPHLLLLGAMLALLLPTSPFVIATALRNAQG